MAAMAEDDSVLKQLMDMGFPEDECKRAMEKADHATVDAALQWLVSNDGKGENAAEAGASADGEGKAKDEDGDSTMGDAAKASEEPKVVRSYRCVETGKLFRTMQDAQLYAERTGRSNFEESDVEVPPLSEEEKAAKLAQLRAKVEERRAQRAEEEKQADLNRELERRRGGREMAAIKEEHERMQREHEIEAEKREKAAFKAQRDRLRNEIANDKAERAAEAARRRGESPEQVKKAFQEAYDRALGKEKDQDKAAKKAALSAEDKMDAAVKDLLAYRAGGDGERALGTIKKMIGNIVATPDEPKFKQINLQNAAFKKRVASLVGGVAFLKACGFTKDTVQQKLVLEDADLNVDILKTALSKLDAALAKA